MTYYTPNNLFVNKKHYHFFCKKGTFNILLLVIYVIKEL